MTIPILEGKDSTEQYTNAIFFNKGGMGEIYKATDIINNIDVAIKLIPITSDVEEDLLSRELQASTLLESENIVKTYFTGKVEILSTNYLYIVQHFYSNGNMRNIIQKDTPIEACFNMMLDILNGMNVVHTEIVHRDLKPENILIDESNHLRITDFGLAKFINEKTKTNSFKGAGTIPYMAPECWLFEENTIQMDIYSLGILFYEILTGELPFKAETETVWRDCHLYETLPDISKSRADTPTKVKQIISKMTQKRVHARYINIDEIITALNESIEHSIESNKAVERLASLNHQNTEQIKSEKLKEEQKEQKIAKYKNFLNFHITELFTQLEQIVESVNSRLEENKITIKEHQYYDDLTQRTFSISSNGISASFQFYDYDVIEKYEKQRSELNRQRQTHEHSFMFQSIHDSTFKTKNIIYLGEVETNYYNSVLGGCFGFNLVLVKSEKDIYGTWYIASFSDSGFNHSSRRNYVQDLDDFLKDFELCFMMHSRSVKFRELEEKDLHRVIEEVIRG